jgi:hypothetical protein
MAEHVDATIHQSTPKKFQPSWIDRCIVWIDNLPGAAWIFYPIGILAIWLIISATLWVDGVVPVGTFSSIPGIFPPALFLFLALYHYLTGLGSQCLFTFRPLLDFSDVDFKKLDRQFSTLPNWISWLSLLFSVPMAYPFLIGDPTTWGEIQPNTSLPLIVFFLIITLFNYSAFALFIRSFRQIRMIIKIHDQATNIDLMKLEPVHAFSKLTSRTGIGLFIIILFGFIYYQNSGNSDWNLLTYILTALISLAIFIIPVIGIRSRLQQKKTDELHRMEDLIRTTNLSLHQKVENSDFDDLGGIQSALNMLTRERDEIKSVSTWPWNTGTIRGFASTLILPVFLRYMYQLLENFF